MTVSPVLREHDCSFQSKRLGIDGPSEFDQFYHNEAESLRISVMTYLYWCHAGPGLFCLKDGNYNLGEDKCVEIAPQIYARVHQNFSSDSTI